MNISLFKVIKGVVILFEILMIGIPIFGVGHVVSKGADLSLGLSGLTLVPEDPDILLNYEDVSLRLKNDSLQQPALIITETKLKLEQASFLKFHIVIMIIAIGLFSVTILEQMRRMIKTVEDGDPFIRSNVWRINLLGTLFMLIPIVAKLILRLEYNWIESSFDFKGLIIRPVSIPNYPWIIMGFLLLTIGKIIAEGIKLKKEQELTI